MKILWLVNIIMPELAEHLGLKVPVFGGWLTGALNALRGSEHDLVVCTSSDNLKTCGHFHVRNISYYVIPKGDIPSMQQSFRTILDSEQPDIIHLYGTEFEHSWALASITDPEKTLVSIQGLVSYYSEHVYGGVPDSIAKDSMYHRLLRHIHWCGNSIEQQRERYIARSKTEIDTLKRVRYVNGGTAWGDGCARLLQPNVKILPCELILRDSFYDEYSWNLDSIEKHSIFTIYSYPIKGFDMFLHGMRWIVKHYPDTHVYVAGSKCKFRRLSGIKKKVMDLAPDYDWYVQGLIEKYGLKDHITFMGFLTEEQMHERLQKSHVFVSASAIENHSTALGEAMISGVPSVASCVGGLQEMIDHGKDGFLYPFNETYMMAEYVRQLFENDELAKNFSQKGHEHAARTYNKEQNCKDLLNMYETISNAEKEKEK